MGLVQDSEQFVRNAWNAVDEMGGDIPPNKNLANLPEGIASIPTGPAVPKSLEQLKEMINRGREIAVGSEISDTWNGSSNPLIVAQKLDSSNNASYGGAIGYILVRKYVDPNNKQIIASPVTYEQSDVPNYLNNAYFNSCSNELKKILSSITISIVDKNWSINNLSDQKFFLMSVTELYGVEELTSVTTNNKTVGIPFEYWKSKTGLSSPSSSANQGRIVYTSTNTVARTWTRSNTGWGSSTFKYLGADGGIYDTQPNASTNGFLPACFIGKD